MNNNKWVQSVIWAVVFLNLIVICRVFIIPRADFMVGHFQENRESLRGLEGAQDMPNQYVNTYKIMKQVRQITKEDSILFLPPDNWEFGSPRSAVIQMLYPRKVYFAKDMGFAENLSHAKSLKKYYVIFNKQWGKELCEKRETKDLKALGFGICAMD